MTYRVDNSWPGGFNATAALKNTGAARAWVVAQLVEIVVDPADLRLLRR